MGEKVKKSILEMARGGVLERVDYAMPNVIDNILDPNTSPTAKRKLTLTIEIKPTEDRQSAIVDYSVKFTPVPSNPVRTMLYMADENTILEMTPQIPGQVDMAGGTQEPPAQLKLIKFG